MTSAQDRKEPAIRRGSHHASLHRFADEAEALEDYHARGWTDGLPVVLPTVPRVEQVLDALGRSGDEVIGVYQERSRSVTVESVAINTVMAGCRPEFAPVVVAIVESFFDPAFMLHVANASTGSAALAFVVGGPIVDHLGMNAHGNVLGSGNRANSTIGRAVRLVQQNALGSVGGAGHAAIAGQRETLDRSVFGQPGKYAGYHFVENEVDVPELEPVRVSRGFGRHESAVVVFATGGHVQVSMSAEVDMTSWVATFAQHVVGMGRLNETGECIVAIPPETAAMMGRDGWSKADLQVALHQATTRDMAWLKRNGWKPGAIGAHHPVQAGDEDRAVAMSGAPDDITLVVTGAPAGAFALYLYPYGGGSVARRIETGPAG